MILLQMLFHFWLVGGAIYLFGFIFNLTYVGSKAEHADFFEQLDDMSDGVRWKKALLYLLAMVLSFVGWFCYVWSDLQKVNE